MYYENELRFLRDMLTKCHLQNLIIDPESALDEYIDKGLRKLFMLESMEQDFADLYPEIKSKTIYRVKDGFFCHYIFMELPYYDYKRVFIVGPYLNTELSRQQILEQGEKMGISPVMFRELETYYAALPIIRDEGLVFAMINSFADFVYSTSDNYEIEEINRENSATFMMDSFEPKADPGDYARSVELMEQRYNFENEMMNAVTSGNTQKAELMMSSFSSLAFEDRVADQLRNIKNYCIIMNTLLRKAAEKGGVHPIYLDKVSSGFAQRIENIHSMDKMPGFMQEIMKTYCRLVRRHSTKDYSPLVQKAIIKIESDLTGDLSLAAMAKLNNVSTGYFSGLFKKETGQTLTEYVNNRRVNHAKHLLKSTNLQIQTIAQNCGVLDFHYFCRIFKKVTGRTPTEYRAAKTLQ